MSRAMTAWLMAGQPRHKKRERRQRWMDEVVMAPIPEAQRIDRAIEVFLEELEEDRLS